MTAADTASVEKPTKGEISFPASKSATASAFWNPYGYGSIKDRPALPAAQTSALPPPAPPPIPIAHPQAQSQRVPWSLTGARQRKEFITFVGYVGRVGYATKGLVYGTLGGIAIAAAIVGQGASTENTSIFTALGTNWWGIFILIALIVGMLCYAAWRCFEGVFQLRVRADAPLPRRIMSGMVVPFASCIFYLVYATSFGLLMMDVNGTAGISGAMSSSAAGQGILIFASLILWAVALHQLTAAIRRTFMREMNKKKLEKDPHARRAVLTFGILGVLGRSLLFALLGVLLFRLGLGDIASSSGNSAFAEAMSQFQASVVGTVLLIITAVGLLFFMTLCFLQVAYKEFLYEGEGIEEKLRQRAVKKQENNQKKLARLPPLPSSFAFPWKKQAEKKSPGTPGNAGAEVTESA